MPVPKTRPGRPRHFEDEQERQLLLGAALACIKQKGYGGTSVADVLGAAGLSTRAFYRHFQAKSDLFLAVYLRDAQSVGERLVVVVGEAERPIAQIETWVDHYLALFYEPRRAARVAALSSADARSVPGYDEAHATAQDLLVAPLVEALRAGHNSGALVSVSPEHDARTILAIAASASEPANPGRFEDRASAFRHVLHYVRAALAFVDT